MIVTDTLQPLISRPCRDEIGIHFFSGELSSIGHLITHFDTST